MRKILLLVASLFVSLACHAASNSLSDNMKSAILKSEAKPNAPVSNHVIYGGQDISRKVIASAHESVWAGQPDYVG